MCARAGACSCASARQRTPEAHINSALALTRAAWAAASLAPAVLAEAAALPAEQALPLLLLPAIGQAHVLALPPPPGGAEPLLRLQACCAPRQALHLCACAAAASVQ